MGYGTYIILVILLMLMLCTSRGQISSRILTPTHQLLYLLSWHLKTQSHYGKLWHKCGQYIFGHFSVNIREKSWYIHDATVVREVTRVIGWLSTNLTVNPLWFIAQTPQPVSDKLWLTLNEIRKMPNPSQRLLNELQDLAGVAISTNACWSAQVWKA